jgi:hypothetical protein
MAALEHLFVVQQAGAQAAPRVNQPTPDQVNRDIRQAMRDAQQALREASQEAGLHAQHAQGVPTPPTPPMLPGMIHDPFDNSNLIPPQAVDIAIGFFIMCAVMVVGWPISRALGRRLERRGEVPAGIPTALTEQLQRIEQAVDAMSIEVERISESQRFMAKLQNQAGVERMALPNER